MPLKNVEDDFRTELVRKTIHIAGLLVPGIYYFVTRRFALTVLVPLTVFMLAVEWARYSSDGFGRWFHKWFGPILRRKERLDGPRRFHAAVWFFIVATTMVAFFPKYVTIIAITLWVVGDGTAALVGRRFGKRRVGDRTLEGSLGFFSAALLAVALTPRLQGLPGEYLICAAGALVGTVVELLSRDPIEDNLSVPLSIGATLWLLYALAYPTLTLNQFGVQ